MQVISRATRSNTYRHNVCRQLAVCRANSVVQQWFEVNSNHKYILIPGKAPETELECKRAQDFSNGDERFE